MDRHDPRRDLPGHRRGGDLPASVPREGRSSANAHPTARALGAGKVVRCRRHRADRELRCARDHGRRSEGDRNRQGRRRRRGTRGRVAARTHARALLRAGRHVRNLTEAGVPALARLQRLAAREFSAGRGRHRTTARWHLPVERARRVAVTGMPIPDSRPSVHRGQMNGHRTEVRDVSEVDCSQLPIRRDAFDGVVNRTLDGSQPDWNLIAHPTAPDGAPNVLLVLIDDAGFGNPSTFGGPIETPNYTRLSESGVRYNRFHVTALCSPTRAAMLTGRNNHAVGFGSVGEFAGGFPGYSATLPRDCAPLPRILRDNGYSTAAFGKWHLTPDGQQGPAGPFDRWPNGWGFDYFYGFLGGGASQWDPCLAENQKIIGTEPAYYDRENPYYLPDAMADKTIEWLHGVRAQDAHKPFFIYFSTGCSHAPHHVAKAWADKYKGKFDQGWDRLREETFARQKALGVIPEDAELTARDEAFPAWDDVPDKLKPFYARQMEVYAGYSENADHNVGRVIDAIDELGELDNTLILWLWGDNGASMEGTTTGSFNELTMQNGIPLTDEMQLQLTERYGGLEAWSSALMAPHYGAAWAWAGNTPFKWGKQVGSHLGGTRNPMVVHWPDHVTDA